MKSHSGDEYPVKKEGKRTLLPVFGWQKWGLLGIMFLLSFGIRLYDGIKEPYLKFDIRQMHSQIISHANYYDLINVPETERKIADTNRDYLEVNEPRVIETLAVLSYLILGKEVIWMPGAFSSIFMLVAGWCLYKIAEETWSHDAALISLGVFLFLPSSIILGNNFQPDSLMLMGVFASAYLALKYFRTNNIKTLLLAGMIAGATIYFKLQAAVLIGIFYLIINLERHGWKKTLTDRNNILFAAMALTPQAILLLDGLVIRGYYREYAEGRILPSLWFTARYWRGWLRMIDRTLSFPLLILALTGILSSRNRSQWRNQLALWAGYVTLGVLWTWNIHTHYYYHLPIFVAAALSIGGLAEYVLDYFNGENISKWVRRGMVGVLAFAVVLSILKVVAQEDDGDLDYAHEVAVSVEIGEILDHDQNVIFLADSYGLPLMYYGDISGFGWYLAVDEEEYEIRHMRETFPLNEEQGILDRIENNSVVAEPDYFVITNFDELENQPLLLDVLNKHFSLIVETEDYMIYDLSP